MGVFVAECPGYPERAQRIVDALNIASQPPQLGADETLDIDTLTRRAFERALAITRGNQSKAALLLGVSRQTMVRYIHDQRQRAA